MYKGNHYPCTRKKHHPPFVGPPRENCPSRLICHSFFHRIQRWNGVKIRLRSQRAAFPDPWTLAQRRPNVTREQAVDSLLDADGLNGANSLNTPLPAPLSATSEPPRPIAAPPDPAHPAWIEQPTRLHWIFSRFFPAIYLLSLARLFVGERVHLWHELAWIFGFTLATHAPAFITARRKALGLLLDRFAKEEKDFHDLYQSFIRRQEEGWQPFLIAILTGGTFAGFRLAVSWDLAPYSLDIARWAVLLVGTLGFALLGQGIWLFLVFGKMMSEMSRMLEQREARLFSWEVLEATGRGFVRTGIGASLLSFAVFWIVLTTNTLFVGDNATLASQFLFAVGVFLLSWTIPLAYFIFPQWRLHRMLVRRKEQIRELFTSKLRELERELLRSPDRQLAENYLRERQVALEIEYLPEWPFTFGSVARIITIAAVPAFAFLFKEILIDVLVGLLKG